MRAIEDDPEAQAALHRAQARMRVFAEALKDPEFQREHEHARREQEQALEALAEAIEEAARVARQDLGGLTFIPPKTLGDWEHPARVAEVPFNTIRSGNFTARDVYKMALAWLDRQCMEGQHGGGPAAAGAPIAITTPDGPATQSPAPSFHPATLAKAVLFERPDIPVAELARQLGVSPGTLYTRNERWKDVRAMLLARKGDKSAPLGSKGKEGNIEAWDTDREADHAD